MKLILALIVTVGLTACGKSEAEHKAECAALGAKQKAGEFMPKAEWEKLYFCAGGTLPGAR